MKCRALHQTCTPLHSRLCALAAVVPVAMYPMFVNAQDAPALNIASKISIVPRVSVTETYTNNVLLNDANKRSELVTQVSPGIRISSTGGRIRGSIDYSLSEVLYANNTSARQSQNTLNASGTIEAIDRWAFVDFSGTIGQQAISAFGTPSNQNGLVGGNSTETSVFRLSPHVRGRLAGGIEYVARYGITSSRTASAAVANVDQRDASVTVSGGQARYGLSWGADANHQSVDYSAGRSTSSSALNARLQYALDERWGTYTRVGRQSNDFSNANGQQSNFVALGASWTPNPDLRVNLDRDNRGFTGLGLSWIPSKRTSVTVARDAQIYGATHRIALAYRTPNTAWTFSDSRSVVSSPAFGPGIRSFSLFDLLSSQFAAGEEDPVKREQYDTFLLANGIRPGITAVGGFLSSSVSIQRSQQLSFAVFGVRNTLSVVGTRTQSSRLDTLSTARDDFFTANSVVQNGLSANLSHRLTARSVVSLVAARQVSSGANGAAGTSLTSLNVNLTAQLSRDASASVGARRVVFDNTTTPYSETALTGSLSVQF